MCTAVWAESETEVGATRGEIKEELLTPVEPDENGFLVRKGKPYMEYSVSDQEQRMPPQLKSILVSTIASWESKSKSRLDLIDKDFLKRGYADRRISVRILDEKMRSIVQAQELYTTASGRFVAHFGDSKNEREYVLHVLPAEWDKWSQLSMARGSHSEVAKEIEAKLWQMVTERKQRNSKDNKELRKSVREDGRLNESVFGYELNRSICDQPKKPVLEYEGDMVLPPVDREEFDAARIS